MNHSTHCASRAALSALRLKHHSLLSGEGEKQIWQLSPVIPTTSMEEGVCSFSPFAFMRGIGHLPGAESCANENGSYACSDVTKPHRSTPRLDRLEYTAAFGKETAKEVDPLGDRPTASACTNFTVGGVSASPSHLIHPGKNHRWDFYQTCIMTGS
jgi:hypothetical protein